MSRTDFPVAEKKPVHILLEVIGILNEAQGKIVSVGMNPDFNDLELGDSPWLPKTQVDASKLISKAVDMLGDFPVQ